ncbi:MAG: endonuclease III domain-containing protein [Thermomicrobiales bacterium]
MPTPTPDLRLRFASIADDLDTEYGPFVLHPDREPLDQLIATILSQHTSDVNTARSWASLRERFPTWDAVIAANAEEVADAIRMGGLANQKAPRIQGVLEEIRERTGSFDLGFLAGMPLGEAKAWLTSLHGVGPKTAACVLLFALGRPAQPVDTHVHRLALRIGLVPPKTTPERCENILEDLLGDNPQTTYAAHKGLIAHGRAICLARAPRCPNCILKDRCDYYAHHLHDPD